MTCQDLKYDQQYPTNPGGHKDPRQKYFRVGQWVKAIRSSKQGGHTRVSVRELADYLVGKFKAKNTLSAGTWYKYRGWALAVIEEVVPLDEWEEAEIKYAVETIKKFKVSSGEAARDRRYKRSVTDEELEAIKLHAQEKEKDPRAKWFLFSALALHTTVLIGARSIEWSDISVIVNEPSDPTFPLRIRIKNGKHDDARSFSSHRELVLDNLQLAEKKVVLTFITLLDIVKQNETLQVIQDRTRSTLHKICNELWPASDTISIHGARHEFKARVSAHLPETYVAALMGHKSIKSSRGYGQISGGGVYSKVVNPRAPVAFPSLQDVLAVELAIAGNKAEYFTGPEQKP